MLTPVICHDYQVVVVCLSYFYFLLILQKGYTFFYICASGCISSFLTVISLILFNCMSRIMQQERVLNDVFNIIGLIYKDLHAQMKNWVTSTFIAVFINEHTPC